MNKQVVGRIVQDNRPVIDVVFENENDLPNLYDALEITRENGEKLILEAQQAIGENVMRTIAWIPVTDLAVVWRLFLWDIPFRCLPAEEIKGRLFNVVGERH